MPRLARAATLAAVALLGLILAGPAHAANPPINVNTTADQAPTLSECSGAANDCAVRQAVDKANKTAGANTINVPAGTYTLTIAPTGADDNSTGDLNVTNSAGTTIVGADPATTFLQAATAAGNGIDRVIHVEADAATTISNLTIRFGQASGTGSGGGILADAALTLNNDIVTQNASGPTVVGGPPNAGGGGVDVEATATIMNSTISSNSAGPNLGGGVRLGAASNASLTITGSTITGNMVSSGNGGGGLVTEGKGPATITRSIITMNQAGDGAGLAEEAGGTVNVQDSSISNNTSPGVAGGLSEEGGGAINITRSTIHANTSVKGGGGIYQNGTGPVTVTQSTIDGNSTGQEGGGIAEEAGDPPAPSTLPSITLINDTITNNHSTDAPHGGATAVGGGGVALLGGGSAVVVNSTITSNTTVACPQSPFSCRGGNLQDDGADPFNLTNTLISGGTPQNCDSGGPNSFFSSGTHGRGTASGHNLASDSTCSLSSANGDLFPVDPMLGPLQNNGGPTFAPARGAPIFTPAHGGPPSTQALMPGSPAIDAGNDSACPATDERGVSRPQGPHCDIGGFELVPPTAPTTTAATSSAAQQIKGAGVAGTSPSTSGCPTVFRARIQLHHVHRLDIVKATIRVNGQTVRKLRGRAVSQPFTITGLPPTRVTVSIRGIEASGRHRKGVRLFNNCPRTKRRHKPLPGRL